MKTIKASLGLPLLTIFFSFTVSGCYTQLAFVNDEQYSVVEPSPTIIYQPEIVPVYIPVPEPVPSPPVYEPLPSAGSSSSVTNSQSQPQRRESGYQRSGESENRPTASSISETRPSGPARGGR
jgi:hypothetical protein